MKFNVDQETGILINGSFNARVCPIEFPLFTLGQLEIQFYKGGVSTDPGGTVIGFTVKKPRDYTGVARLVAGAFAAEGDGPGLFSAELIFDSDLLEEDFAANPDFVDYFGQISWLPTGAAAPTLSIPFPIRIMNSYVRGTGASTTIPAQFSYRPDITGLTGGAGKLESIATIAVTPGFLVAVHIGASLNFYQLQAGAADIGADDIAPLDYDAGTNSKKWVKVL
jgi:hypothetical protein